MFLFYYYFSSFFKTPDEGTSCTPFSSEHSIDKRKQTKQSNYMDDTFSCQAQNQATHEKVMTMETLLFNQPSYLYNH